MSRGDQRCACACHWNWGWLNGAFGATKISPMYADALVLVERKEAFLLIETKHRDEQATLGQRYLLEAFSRKHGCISCLVYGEDSTPERYQFCKRGVWYPERETSREHFREVVGRWFRSANIGDLLFWERPAKAAPCT